ncbi:MAG: response regulator [Nitrospinae bacterium]|nr:response regulator [Nitrospinota bacterium]
MVGQKRILIIEDTIEFSNSLSSALRTEGYAVDTASDLDKARRALLDKTYHLAIVDLMLGGQTNQENYDGMEALKLLQRLDEGTKAIVLSAQKETDIAAETLQSLGAFRYLSKDAVFTHGLNHLLNLVEVGVANATLTTYGAKSSPLNFLAHTLDSFIWANDCMRSLQVAGGYNTLSKLVEKLLKPYLPLLPERDVSSALTLAADGSPRLSGELWSKATGQAIRLSIYNSKAISAETDGRAAALASAHAENLAGVVYASDKSRDRFEESIP